jgi:hypothetical protein
MCPFAISPSLIVFFPRVRFQCPTPVALAPLCMDCTPKTFPALGSWKRRPFDLLSFYYRVWTHAPSQVPQAPIFKFRLFTVWKRPTLNKFWNFTYPKIIYPWTCFSWYWIRSPCKRRAMGSGTEKYGKLPFFKHFLDFYRIFKLCDFFRFSIFPAEPIPKPYFTVQTCSPPLN